MVKRYAFVFIYAILYITVYFDLVVQSKGLLYGVALTFFTKGAAMNIGFGLLWSRTRNMIAPAFVHAWSNALPNLTQFKF